MREAIVGAARAARRADDVAYGSDDVDTAIAAIEIVYEVADGDILHADVVSRADAAGGGEARLMADWTLRTRGLTRATCGAFASELALPGMLTATFATRGARRCGASGGGAHAPRVASLSFAFDAAALGRELEAASVAAAAAAAFGVTPAAAAALGVTPTSPPRAAPVCVEVDL